MGTIPDPYEYAYVCQDGHLVIKPKHGTYGTCQEMMRLPAGSFPCGNRVTQVRLDEALEAAYLVGGGRAVLEIMQVRAKEG